MALRAVSEPSRRQHPLRALSILLALVVLAVVVLLAVLDRKIDDTGATARATTTALAASSKRPITLNIHPSEAGQSFTSGAVGLSVEADELAKPNLNVDDAALVSFMRQLGPAIIRLGGNSVDTSWWTANGEPAPHWATSVVTPANLSRLNVLLEATGWRVVLGLDLGHFSPTRAASEASTASAILGSRLLGFELGNEPDSYAIPRVADRPHSYDPQAYVHDVESYIASIRAVVTRAAIYGPDLSTELWLPQVATEGGTLFNALTEHYYPTLYSVGKGACQAKPAPTAHDLLSFQTREAEELVTGALIAAGQAAHREVWFSETNDTASCDTDGAPETSPVFASALWALDWTLRAASNGVRVLAFHGRLGRCGPNTVSPICIPTGSDQVVARPEYYGLLAARQLEGGRFVAVRTKVPYSDFSSFATLQPSGRVVLAIDNFSSVGGTAFALPATGFSGATVERLAAKSVLATSGVTLGGSSALADGGSRPHRQRLKVKHGDFLVTVQHDTAAIVTLHPQ